MSESQFQCLYVEQTRNACFIRICEETLREDFRVRDELFRFLTENDKPILMLNLEGVQFASAAFLATLVKMHMELQKQDRRIKIYNISQRLKDVFVNTKLDKYLDIHESEDDAFRALQMLYN